MNEEKFLFSIGLFGVSSMTGLDFVSCGFFSVWCPRIGGTGGSGGGELGPGELS